MLFSVCDEASSASQPNEYPHAYLVKDRWNDYGFVTQFFLQVYDADGQFHEIGNLKVGRFGMSNDSNADDRDNVTNIPESFEYLESQFFSLGQSPEYYTNLINLSSELCNTLLEDLRDIVSDGGIYELAIDEPVTRISLLRDVSLENVRNQFVRIIDGKSALSAYQFSYAHEWQRLSGSPTKLDFAVKPRSKPPTNVHVLIGRNGVGKSSFVRTMVDYFRDNFSGSQTGTFEFGDQEQKSERFSRVIYFSFSAFDDYCFEDLVSSKRDDRSIYQPDVFYIGLRKRENAELQTQTPDALTSIFRKSAENIQGRDLKSRWKKALKYLETDPYFADIGLSEFVNASLNNLESLFDSLSSGHKVVLLTITAMVEKVSEKTLVLIDEPETHLHPPLVSSFIRALSELLIHRNGVAILATHSPVVLQEVPRSCVWKIVRSGMETTVKRPNIETFGESIGTLTRQVFGLEVDRSGFYALLKDSVSSGSSLDEIFEEYEDKLGAEAQLMLTALAYNRDQD